MDATNACAELARERSTASAVRVRRARAGRGAGSSVELSLDSALLVLRVLPGYGCTVTE